MRIVAFKPAEVLVHSITGSKPAGIGVISIEDVRFKTVSCKQMTILSSGTETVPRGHALAIHECVVASIGHAHEDIGLTSISTTSSSVSPVAVNVVPVCLG